MRIRNLFLAALLVMLALPVGAQRFHASDPMLLDDDRLIDVVEQPEYIEFSDLYDRVGHIFHDFGAPDFSEAVNVNSLDEVPDSSWFTNRIGVRDMSIADLRRGPNSGNTPDPGQTWTVFKGKSQGITPGFHIKDEVGDRYVIKVDPVHIPELSTAAEAIATKIFHALGYNVPENYIVHYNPDKLEIKPGTMASDSYGQKKPMGMRRLRAMLRRVPRAPDGTIRVIASKYFDGLPLGPFRYYETRSDDPNDVILHEHRRELRGLRLFAAWTNHDDTRAQNTQDSWNEKGDRHYVKHWLMDFGSTFGSGSVDIQLPNLGFDWWLPLNQMKTNARSFGFHVPFYRTVDWPCFPEFESVGRWEGEAFDAEDWRNDYPNPAFVRMTRRDAFWAAKILMRFTPEQLRAIVETGEFANPEHTHYFHEVLVERQLKSGRFGLNGINPLDEFRLQGDRLAFTNLSEKYGFAGRNSTSYRLGWHLYDNDHDLLGEAFVRPQAQAGTSVPLPTPERFHPQKNIFLVARIESIHPEHPHWEDPVLVYLRSNGPGKYEVAGIERTAPAETIGMP